MRAWSLPTAVTERSPSPVGRFAIRSVTVAARVTGGASYVGKQLDRSAFAQLGDPLKVGAGCSPVEVGQPGDSAVPAQELAEAGVPETVGCGAELVERVRHSPAAERPRRASACPGRVQGRRTLCPGWELRCTRICPSQPGGSPLMTPP